MSGHKRALIVSDFTNAETGESFKKGDTPSIPSGEFGNYEAAGLVRSPPPAKTAPVKRSVKRAKTAKAKPAATPTPAPAPQPNAAEIANG